MKTLDAQSITAVSGGEMSTSTVVVLTVLTAVSPLMGAVATLTYFANAREDC
jgi:hypothetical protein